MPSPAGSRRWPCWSSLAALSPWSKRRSLDKSARRRRVVSIPLDESRLDSTPARRRPRPGRISVCPERRRSRRSASRFADLRIEKVSSIPYADRPHGDASSNGRQHMKNTILLKWKVRTHAAAHKRVVKLQLRPRIQFFYNENMGTRGRIPQSKYSRNVTSMLLSRRQLRALRLA